MSSPSCLKNTVVRISGLRPRSLSLRQFGAPRSRLALKAVLSGGASRCISVVLTAISLPLAVRYLGAERYGVWVTISTTAVWINLLDLGIGNTLTNRISQAFARDEELQATRAMTNAIFLTGCMAIAAACVCCAAFARVDWVHIFRLSSPAVAIDARSTSFAAALLTLLALPANVANKALAGHQQLHIANYVSLAGAMSSLIGLAAGILLRFPMALLFVAGPGSVMLANVALAFWLLFYAKPWLRPRWQFLSWRSTRSLCSSGASFLAIQIASVVVFSSDNLIVGHYLGAGEVTPYSVTWRMAALGSLLPGLLFPALWPAYAEARAKCDFAWIQRAFATALRTTLFVNGLFALALISGGRVIIRYWAGPSAVPPEPLLIAMAAWILLSGVMTAQSCLLAAVDRIQKQAALSLAAAALNLGLSIYLVQRIGSLGVILSTIGSYLAVLVVPQTKTVVDVLQFRAVRSSPALSAAVQD